MARPKGSKNRRTVLREAEKAMSKSEEFVDSMHVLEYTMRHFYTRALLLTQINGKPEQIDANLKEAAAIAEMIVPYRHPRLRRSHSPAIRIVSSGLGMMPVLTRYARRS